MSRNLVNESSGETSIKIPIPAKEPNIYGRKVVDDILLFLSRNRFNRFSRSELAQKFDYSESTVLRAVDTLEKNGLVVSEFKGNTKLTSINRSRLSVPEDPLLRISQEEFQEPTKVATETLVQELDGVIGIILYGSVARGDADRQSDIDLWVAVKEERSSNQMKVNEIEKNLAEERFDGERYDFHIVVEALDTIPAFTEDIARIVMSGIPVYKTDEFQKLRNILAHGRYNE